MAYQSQISIRAHGGAIAAVVAIHVGLLLMLLNLSSRADRYSVQPGLHIIDIRQLVPSAHRKLVTKPRSKAGGSAPKNIQSHATQVAAPKPQIETPHVQQIAATQVPHEGTDPTQGASHSAGPGTGAGGSGSGAGNGIGANGSGAGDLGVVQFPRLVSPVMNGRDFSSDQLNQWPRGATVFLRLRVDARGYVAECMIDRGTGVSEIDGTICNMAHERLRFRPALNRSGQAVAGWFGYAQPAPR